MLYYTIYTFFKAQCTPQKQIRLTYIWRFRRILEWYWWGRRHIYALNLPPPHIWHYISDFISAIYASECFDILILGRHFHISSDRRFRGFISMLSPLLDDFVLFLLPILFGHRKAKSPRLPELLEEVLGQSRILFQSAVQYYYYLLIR